MPIPEPPLFRLASRRAAGRHPVRPSRLLAEILPLLLAASCSHARPADEGGKPSGPPPVYGYRVVRTYPHDPRAFTQGLVYAEGYLYEGTGLYGYSSLRRVDLESGAVLEQRLLDPELFGEGLTLFGDRLIQLTWRSGLGLVYDRRTLAPVDRFEYPTEGWGLTHDGQRLVMSDGTARLYFLDPRTYAETGQLAVHDQGVPVTQLNELEWVEGEIYANIWQTDRIARISPGSGAVAGWIDLGGLLRPEDRRQPVDVLNGIAYDPLTRRLFVTGKLWPLLFQIELVPSP
ncbi:MAG: glutaminyl-peptide cyclotransferase [Candidatus Latescibacterota bacterium]